MGLVRENEAFEIFRKRPRRGKSGKAFDSSILCHGLYCHLVIPLAWNYRDSKNFADQQIEDKIQLYTHPEGGGYSHYGLTGRF